MVHSITTEASTCMLGVKIERAIAESSRTVPMCLNILVNRNSLNRLCTQLLKLSGHHGVEYMTFINKFSADSQGLGLLETGEIIRISVTHVTGND